MCGSAATPHSSYPIPDVVQGEVILTLTSRFYSGQNLRPSTTLPASISALLLLDACSLETRDVAVGHGLNTPTERDSNCSSLASGGRQESGGTQILIGDSQGDDAVLDQVCAR